MCQSLNDWMTPLKSLNEADDFVGSIFSPSSSRVDKCVGWIGIPQDHIQDAQSTQYKEESHEKRHWIGRRNAFTNFTEIENSRVQYVCIITSTLGSCQVGEMGLVHPLMNYSTLGQNTEKVRHLPSIQSTLLSVHFLLLFLAPNKRCTIWGSRRH